jgi:gas vesicle protein
MSESVIIGIFTCIGTIIGILASYLISLISMKKDKEFKMLKNNVKRLAKQVISYWNLEKKYSEELGKLTSKAPKTVLQDFRSEVENDGYERPTMTENDANNFLK